MKKMMCISLVLIMILAMKAAAFADSDTITNLQDLSDMECIAFLNDYNVSIPELYENEIDCIPFVRAIFEIVETDANTHMLYECYALEKFANDIQMAIYEYYSGVASFAFIQSSSPSILEDNIMHGDWLPEYETYNCYGYAIERKEWLRPGISWWLEQNEPAETYEYNGYASLSNQVNWIKEDLEYYGYSVVSDTTTLPNVQVGGHVRIICFRLDLDETLQLNRHGLFELNHDFHFMRMDSNGSWYHKPGATNPLKYMHTPTNSRAWVCEGYNGIDNVYFRDEDYEYESTIYYIQYLTPHEWEYASNGSGQHTKTCSICGCEEIETCHPEYTNLTNTRHSVSCKKCDYYIASQACDLYYRAKDGKTHTVSCAKCENRRTQNCSIVSTFAGAGQHENVCSKCGHEEAEACTISHIYAGDGSQSHTHNAVCTVCGNQSQTGASCTFVYRSYGDNTHSYLCSLCGYVKIDHAACFFNANNICRVCGAPKNGAVINKLEEVTPE